MNIHARTSSKKNHAISNYLKSRLLLSDTNVPYIESPYAANFEERNGNKYYLEIHQHFVQAPLQMELPRETAFASRIMRE